MDIETKTNLWKTTRKSKMQKDRKILLETLQGKPSNRVPIWMMRQAGRHLPEYRELRARAPNFIDFCYSPSLATEATLQPIRRYEMDGAILFADILLVLDALGLKVRFEPGIGPIIDRIEEMSSFSPKNSSAVTSRLSPVIETVARVKDKLEPKTTLIGFAGAPWTVAIYAIEGQGKTDKSLARLWAYKKPEELKALLDVIVEATVGYLEDQANAGADALMLFESWASELTPDLFQTLVISPTKKLIGMLRDRGVTQPLICFPRGAGVMLPKYVKDTQPDGVGLDTMSDPKFVEQGIDHQICLQGHLDPLALLSGGEQMQEGIETILQSYKHRAHIFNLGHGVIPQTPIAHVEETVRKVREFEREF